MQTRLKYDQTFLGLITDTSRKVSESALEHLAGEAEDLETERVGKEGEKNADETQLSDTANFLCLYRIMLSDTCVLSIAHQDM